MYAEPRQTRDAGGEEVRERSQDGEVHQGGKKVDVEYSPDRQNVYQRLVGDSCSQSRDGEHLVCIENWLR